MKQIKKLIEKIINATQINKYQAGKIIINITIKYKMQHTKDSCCEEKKKVQKLEIELGKDRDSERKRGRGRMQERERDPFL